MISYQLLYTYFYRQYNGEVKHSALWIQTINAFGFVSLTTFYLAHWVFAFCYLALTYRFQLVSKGMPEGAYNRRLNWLNAIVCLAIVAITSIYGALGAVRNKKAQAITYDIL